MSYCPHCGAAATGGGLYCSHCGQAFVREAPAYVREPTAGGAAVVVPAVATTAPTRAVTMGMAIAALLLNILVWPGLGSLVAGEKAGWAQGFLFLFGIPLTLVLIGIPMLVGAWIWALVTAIDLVRRASEQERAQAAYAARP